jgi:hypothetical protein
MVWVAVSGYATGGGMREYASNSSSCLEMTKCLRPQPPYWLE